MAILRTAMALGILTPPRPQTAGAVHQCRYVFDSGDVGAVGAGDLVVLGPQQPFSHVVDAYLQFDGDWTGITNLTVGLFDAAANAGAGAVGNELFDAVAPGSVLVRLTKPDWLRLPMIEGERQIGMKFSGAVARLAGRRATLSLLYRQ
jgi:hypothetical protein